MRADTEASVALKQPMKSAFHLFWSQKENVKELNYYISKNIWFGFGHVSFECCNFLPGFVIKWSQILEASTAKIYFSGHVTHEQSMQTLVPKPTCLVFLFSLVCFFFFMNLCQEFWSIKPYHCYFQFVLSRVLRKRECLVFPLLQAFTTPIT